MDLPTFGARNLKQHLAKARSSGRVSLPLSGAHTASPRPLGAPQPMACVLGLTGSLKPAFQSVSASALLKQQKQHMLEMRKKRSEEIQKR